MHSQSRLILAITTILAGYVASTFATTWLIGQVYSIHCVQTFLTSQCNFRSDEVVSPSRLIVLATFVLSGMSAIFIWGRRTVAYPFLMLLGSLCLAALMLDFVSGRPVIHASKIINDTLNILAAVIASSFILLLVIIRKQPYSMAALLCAVVISFAIKTMSATAFLEVRGGVFGVTELFLLYIVYAFGAFTLHLMTVSGFVGRMSGSGKVR
jgi:hypothetical protein